MRNELESAAVELVRDLTEESVDVLNRLVDLAEAVEEMNTVNAEVLGRELTNLKDMISLENSRISKKEDSVYVGDIFDSNYGTTSDYDGEANEYIAIV